MAKRKLQNEAVTPGVLTPTKKVKAEEVDADEFAGSLEKDLDHVKALKIQELRLVKQIKKIREARAKLRKRITRKI